MEWFGRRGRKFPWRGEVGWYGVLTAEFMLIRTRSEVALKIFLEFMRRYPEPNILCSSDPESVASYFRRLGLPSRAERLVNAVCTILGSYGGVVPCDYGRLVELPGVGDYIARVILSRVCGKHYAFVDSNVVRVVSRFSCRLMKIPEVAQILERAFASEDLVNVNMALIDVGSLVCKPTRPRCSECPIGDWCCYYASYRR